MSRNRRGTGCGDLVVVALVILISLAVGFMFYRAAFSDCMAINDSVWYCLAVLN